MRSPWLLLPCTRAYNVWSTIAGKIMQSAIYYNTMRCAIHRHRMPPMLQCHRRLSTQVAAHLCRLLRHRSSIRRARVTMTQRIQQQQLLRHRLRRHQCRRHARKKRYRGACPSIQQIINRLCHQLTYVPTVPSNVFKCCSVALQGSAKCRFQILTAFISI